jgi:uncharacterized protein
MITQRPYLIVALILIVALEVHFLGTANKMKLLFPIGIGMGVALYHAAFGFTAAYRRAFIEKDLSGVTAQMIMLAVAMILFAPILAKGEVFGHGVGGAIAPVGLSMVFGAFIFGIGMQLAGGCGSGTLFTAGGGNVRMVIVLLFFCIGGFWGSLDLQSWQQLPGFGSVSLGKTLGWEMAVGLQLGALVLVYATLRWLGATNQRSLWFGGKFAASQLLFGPWPLLFSALLLALFNWLTLLIAGHPWSVTWAFALWAAKASVMMGWDPLTSGFWAGGFQERALGRSVLLDVTSVMNFGIMLGAFVAASLSGKISPRFNMGWRPLIGAVIGGLLLGYGARLAYGCNIGAFFSGIASTSLHGWVWIVAALIGNWLGVRLRPQFGLANS